MKITITVRGVGMVKFFALLLDFVVFLYSGVPSEAMAIEVRKASTVSEFRREHPCPTTGKARGSCKGYVVDHIVPLCAGGRDAATNMQWQPIGSSYKKDVRERAACRWLAKHPESSFSEWVYINGGL